MGRQILNIAPAMLPVFCSSSLSEAKSQLFHDEIIPN